MRRGEGRAGAGDLDAPGIRRLGSGKELEQGRLAGAVLAEEAIGLAGSGSKETSSSACTPDSALKIPVMRSSGSGMAGVRKQGGPTPAPILPERDCYFSSPSRFA